MGVNRKRNPRRMLWIGGLVLVAAALVGGAATVLASGAQPEPSAAGQPAVEVHHGGEASLVVPDLSQAQFLGVSGHSLLLVGLLVAVGGLFFGHHIYHQVRRLPVHQSMAEIADLIYETCKTYLLQQGKFLLILEVFIAVIIVFYFGFLQRMEPIRVVDHPALQPDRHRGQLRRRVVRHPDQHLRELAHGVRQPPRACRSRSMAIPLRAGMSIGMMLISVELFIMLCILLFIPGDYAGSCFIGFAIGESLGAAALRIAGGIFTKIADIGSDLMKIVFNIKEDDARNPGVIADCTGDNAGDSVGPSADGFETYGVTGVALISFILLAVTRPAGAGPAAGLDLHDAHRDGRRQRRCRST